MPAEVVTHGGRFQLSASSCILVGMATKRTGTKGTKAAAKTTKGRVAPGKPGAPDVEAKVDADAKRKYEALLATIEASRGEESLMFDRLWEAAGEIVARRWYLVGGYETAEEFLREVLHEEPRNAYRFILVARYASPREEEKYGTTKLYAALKLIEKKVGQPIEHPPLPIAFDALRIDADGKKLGLAEASVAQIEAATRALDGAKKVTRDPTQRALEAALADVSSLEGVRVTVRNGLATFSSVPVAAFGHFAQLVSRIAPHGDAPQRSPKPKKAGARIAKAKRRGRGE